MGRMNTRAIGAVIVAALLMLAPMGSTAQAYVQAACKVDAFRQHDMTGVFVSAESQMRVAIYPCGGSHVQWTNAYGVHNAVYYSTNRLAGGGVAASRIPESTEALDATERIGYKPAEQGYIQIITITPYAEVIGIYRLKKIADNPS